jgi:hypothetical protein
MDPNEDEGEGDDQQRRRAAGGAHDQAVARAARCHDTAIADVGRSSRGVGLMLDSCPRRTPAINTDSDSDSDTGTKNSRQNGSR